MADIESLLSSMSARQKVGQLCIFGWDGKDHQEHITYSDHAKVLVEEFEVGGIILLGRNVGTPAETAACMNELQAHSKIPLFIVADQEGGMVCRFKDPYVVFPSNMAIGATGDESYAYKAAKATAEQLRAVGVNFDFAPCMDTNNNPLNPIIGTRSYSDVPDKVSTFGKQAIQGFHDGGVLTSAKHFPGHGDTSVDSHLALPSIDFPRERLDRIEIPPFKAAMEAGVATIMTTHILFPQIDPELPATISPTILGGILRGELGWDGVVVTDCLEMEGVKAKWGTPASAVMAVKAGVDCPLICHTLELQRQAVEMLLKAVESGEISQERLDLSVRRILNLKQRFGILDGVAPADPRQALARVASDNQKALALEIARKSVTVVKDAQNAIGSEAAKGKVAVVSMHWALEKFVGFAKEINLNVEGIELKSEMEKAPVPDDAELVIALTCPSEPWTAGMDEESQARFVKQIAASGKTLIVYAIRDPYDIRWFPEVKTYIATYGYRPENLKAAAELILGVLQPVGHLPVELDTAI